MKASLLTTLPRDRRGPGFIGACAVAGALGLLCLAHDAGAVTPTAKTAIDRDDAPVNDSYWRDRERGWFWYDDPLPERSEVPKPRSKALPTISAPAAPKKPSELVEFEALQKRVEDLRNIAIINPSEQNIRNYLNIQNFVIEKASTFADVAQRVIWATPELDPTVTGRPVNAKALEVFDREQAGARTNTVAQLSQTYIASDASPLRPDVVAAVTAAVHANYPNTPIIPGMSAGATDGVFYRAAGIPTYGVGEIFMKDSDDFSHGLNERVPVTSFYNGLTHWRILLTTLAGTRH